MNCIKVFNPARLTNREAVTFLMQVIESAKSVDSESENKALENLVAKNTEFNTHLTNDSTVERTNQLLALLTRMGENLHAVRLIAKGFTYTADNVKKEAAEKVLAIFAKYGRTFNLGNFERVSKYRHITGEIDALKIPADVLPVAEFIEAIKNFPDDFNAAYTERADFMASTVGRITESRRAAEDAYRTFVSYANGLAVADPEKYGAFVAQVNQIIAQASLMIGNRANKAAGTEAEPDTAEC